jgi:serine protease Do
LEAVRLEPNLELAVLLASAEVTRQLVTEMLLRARAAGVTPTPPAENPKAPREVFGTGFSVSRDGKVLTNAHVVEGCAQIRISLGGQVAVAQIVAQDVQDDLAVVKADMQPTDTARFRLSVRQGEDVTVYGFPLAGLLSSGGNVTTGNVTALSGIADDRRFLQISSPVQPGNSGGPLFDQSGNVIGIVVGKLDALKIAGATSDIPQNVNFAIKSSVATSFLESNGIAYTSGKTGDRLSAVDIAERAKTFTVQIECQK